MIILFIDDQEIRHELVERLMSKSHTILHTHGYEDTIAVIQSCQQPIGMILFDHDLMDYVMVDGKEVERTGYTIINYMREHIPQDKYPPMAIVHSYNERAKHMTEDLNKMGIHTRQIPFSGDMIKALLVELEPQ